MYIRTDGNHIYERIEQRILGEQYRHNLNSEWENIIEEADTIEELCDEFVITCVEDYEYKHFYPKIADINDALEYATEDVYTVYGAIWCEFGLKYVAKLNDKGELELI